MKRITKCLGALSLTGLAFALIPKGGIDTGGTFGNTRLKVIQRQDETIKITINGEGYHYLHLYDSEGDGILDGGNYADGGVGTHGGNIGLITPNTRNFDYFQSKFSEFYELGRQIFPKSGFRMYNSNFF